MQSILGCWRRQVSKQHREETTTKPGDRHHLHGNGNPTLTISCSEAWVPQQHFAEKCSSSSGGCSIHVPMRERSTITAAARKWALNYSLLLTPCVPHYMGPEIVASTMHQTRNHFGLSLYLIFPQALACEFKRKEGTPIIITWPPLCILTNHTFDQS